jgi:hypothetical protein
MDEEMKQKGKHQAKGTKGMLVQKLMKCINKVYRNIYAIS